MEGKNNLSENNTKENKINGIKQKYPRNMCPRT
jgi:hypothetical protein